jgi:integrase
VKPVETRNRYGSVKPYTRHQSDCPFQNERDYNACSCSKWLYVNRRGSKPRRYSLVTPSWGEAVAEASRVLEGFHPEIAEARRQKAEQVRQVTTIQDAVQMWLDRTQHMYGNGGTYQQYRSLLKGLVRYVDKWNLGKAGAERKVLIEQLDVDFCTQWYQSWKYSNSVMRQRWGVIRSFFTYLQQQGKITFSPVLAIRAVPKERIFLNVPFTDQQYNDILNYALATDPGPSSDCKVYRERLRIFIELLRWTGIDIGDAIQFRPSMIDADGVLRYIRTKTGIQAVVPLERHRVEMLKEIPLAPNSIRDMPFRYAGNDLASDVHNWSRRIRRVLHGSGVTGVQLVEKSGVPAYDRNGNPITKATNVKMFRHTFAVGWLAAGADKETVAKMLGHTSTDMIDAHYAPWVKGLDDAHIHRVREIMGQVKLKKGLKLVAKKGVRVAAAAPQ